MVEPMPALNGLGTLMRSQGDRWPSLTAGPAEVDIAGPIRRHATKASTTRSKSWSAAEEARATCDKPTVTLKRRAISTVSAASSVFGLRMATESGGRPRFAGPVWAGAVPPTIRSVANAIDRVRGVTHAYHHARGT